MSLDGQDKSGDVDLEVLGFWHKVTLETVRGDRPDLTARQMAVLLTVYLSAPPHTVKGLAALLKASKPAITRALDTLSQRGLIRRKRDEKDRRNVLVQQTDEGLLYLQDFAEIVQAITVRSGDTDGLARHLDRPI